MRDLIFASIENWDDVWRRNQFVCAEMVRRNPEMRILFVGLPRNVSHELRHGRVRALMGRGTYRAAGVEGVTVTHPWKLLPDSMPGGRAINQWLYRIQVRGVARRMGIGGDGGRPVLWINPHWAGHLAGKFNESAVVYDVTDDWTQMTQSPRMKRLVERQDRELCAKADAVIVCSERLAELKRPMNRQVELIPNGVDAEHYAGLIGEGAIGEASSPKDPGRRGYALPRRGGGGGGTVGEWARPVLGYTGTVHPDRVDVELVRAVAERWASATGGSVVLVGPDHLSAADGERLALPNVHRVGPVAYAEVPAYMRAFDVCIVPHRMSEFTESLNPIKLWEYLAAGKPIVSTDVAGFRDYPQLVRLARNADEFVAAAHAATGEIGTAAGVALAEERRRIARENSWEQRVDEIEKVIADCVVRRSGMTERAAEIAVADVHPHEVPGDRIAVVE